jgi:hypothetical protein
MKVEYNNLYTHFVLTTLNRVPLISEALAKVAAEVVLGIKLGTIWCKNYCKK